MQAKNLRQALNILDPEHSLREDRELQAFFVERPNSPIEDLRLLLLDTTKPQKILFTGHRGSGKSTELAKLGQKLRQDFFIVSFSIKDTLNLHDLTYVDVVLSLGLELVRQSSSKNVKIKPEILDHVLQFAKDVTRDVEMGVKNGGDVSVELNLFVTKLSSKLSTEDATRTTVREKVSHRLSDLLESIEFLSKEIEEREGRRLLVIIEDIDKADLNTAKELFYGHATSLLAPPVSIIYTFPTALRHDNDFMQIKMNFPEVHVLPNIKARMRNGDPDELGMGRLGDILLKRVDESLFTKEAKRCLAEFSSGIPRELIALGRRACLEAIKSNLSAIDKTAVERAAQSRRIDYQVLLTTEQIELLKNVASYKRVENDEAHRALLHNLSVLEFRNDTVWYDIHPLVATLLGKDTA